jgi:hypothetical protein
MSGTYPVLFIHTTPRCVLCTNLVMPENWKKLTDTINSVNPNSKIKLIQHDNYQQPNQDYTQIYPRVIKGIR